MRSLLLCLLLCLLLGAALSGAQECKLSGDYPWAWRCDAGRCVRHPSDEIEDGISLNTCKLICSDDSVLWPRPTGPFSVGNSTVSFLPDQVSVTQQVPDGSLPVLDRAVDRFKKALQDMIPEGGPCPGQYGSADPDVGSRAFKVHIHVDDGDTSLSLDTSEFYQLLINHTDDQEVRVIVYADTFYGARHALETLTQLVNYDDVNDALQTVTSAMVSDAPVYSIRALTLDTSRNFITVGSLQRTIDGMAMNKLNTLHWHITDTNSFPIEVRREPRLTRYGAHTPRQVYTTEEVLALVRYARDRGVRLLPELDMPAHVGFGWQWGEKAGLGKLGVCLGREPWQSYCVQPPCGQMNIINDNLYPVLGKIFAEFDEVFQPDIFHLGGDEVNLNCWKTTPEIAEFVKQKGGDPEDDDEYMKLWIDFQERSYQLWHNVTGKSIPLILWTSHLTEKPASVSKLDPYKYIIQIWTTGKDKQIGELLHQGYKLIMSNYDAWYLDCGFSAWVGDGNNWCSPFKSWQTVYDNSPRAIAQSFESDAEAGSGRVSARRDLTHQILGGSAALWSEQTDDTNLDTKLWPRGAALAERLWSEPETGYAAAEIRFIHHRNRMVAAGINAETLQPEYCHQYEGSCYINKG